MERNPSGTESQDDTRHSYSKIVHKNTIYIQEWQQKQIGNENNMVLNNNSKQSYFGVNRTTFLALLR